MFLRRKPKGAEGPVVMTLSSGCVISTKTRTLFMIFFYFNRCVCVCVFYTFLKRCHDYPAGLGIFTGGELLIFFLFQVFLHNIYFILYFSLSFVCPLRYPIPGHLPFFFLRKAGTGDCEKRKLCAHTYTDGPHPPLFFPSGLVQQQKSWGQWIPLLCRLYPTFAKGSTAFHHE